MNLDFRAYSPPTLETFADAWLRKARWKMRSAVRAARLDLGAASAWCAYGEADAAVSVLYDTNHDRAYGAVVSLQRVRRAIEKVYPS